MHRFLSRMRECCLSLILDSTFVDGEVKEFKEFKEVRAICFVAKYTSKRLLAITSNDRVK